VEITEVRIKLMEDSDDRLQGFCSITFDDCFVVRDLKIIEGTNGPFVAMPSRKLTAHCPKCRCKNHLRASHCNQCGSRLKEDLGMKDADGRAKLYADIAHPINSACREMIQTRVIAEFEAEKVRSHQPGYVSRYDDHYDYDDDLGAITTKFEPAANPAPRAPHIQTPPHHPSPQPTSSGSHLPPPHRLSETRNAESSANSSAAPASPTVSDKKNDDFGAGIFQ